MTTRGKTLWGVLIVAAVLIAGAVVAWQRLGPKPTAVRPVPRKPGAGPAMVRKKPAARPEPRPVRLTVSAAAARLLPAKPVLFVSLEGLDAMIGTIEASKWWRSVRARLLAHPGVAGAWRRFLESYRQHLGGRDFTADVSLWRRLLGRQVCLAIYIKGPAAGSRHRKVVYALAFTGPRGDPPQRVLDRIRDFLGAILKAPLTWQTAGSGPSSIRTLTGPGLHLHFAVLPGQLFFMSNDRGLLSGLNQAGAGDAAGRLAGDGRYRALVRAAPRDKRLALFLRLERVLPFLVGTLKGDDLTVRIVRSISGLQLTSTGPLTRLTLFFRPGAVSSVLGPGRGGAGLTTTDLLPGSPLIYLGLSGPRWVKLLHRWKWESGPGRPGRGRVDRAIQRVLGLPGLDRVLDLLDGEAALAVMGLASGGLPRIVTFVRMKDRAVARTRLPWLIETLKRGPLGGEVLWRTHQAGPATIPYVIAPVVGAVGAIATGPYLVFSNDLGSLGRLLGSARAETTLFWGYLRSRKEVNFLFGADTARLLDLAPSLMNQLGPVLKVWGRRSWPAWLPAALDWARVCRAMVAWARWDGRRRALSLGLKFWLADRQVKLKLPGAK